MGALSLEWMLGGEPSAPAVGFSDGRTVTYAELRAAVGARAVEPRSTVSLPAVDAYQQLVLALRAFASGAVAVPLGGALGRIFDARAALLIFTSGSSGVPKGVLLSAEGLRANVEAILSYLPVRQIPDTALVLPLHYSYALVGQALTTLRSGGTLWLFSELRYPAQKLAAIAKVGRPVGLSSVPTSLRQLAATQLDAAAPLTLGYVASAGGRLDPAVVEQVRSAFGPVRFFNQYGLTEASPRVTAISDDEPAFALGSVGRALPGLSVFAVDSAGQRMPTDASGELAVRGPSVMLEYLDEPDETARVLSPDGTLKTGDWGHVDRDGYVYVEGRKDGVVKVAGERVSLEQVAAAFRAITGVRDVQVVALPDEALGSRLVAVIEGDPEAAALKAKGRALPAQQRPARYVMVVAMPRTANGKVDLVAVREIAETGA